MQQFDLTHATCLDVKEEHYCLPVGKRIYYRWVHDKDQAMIDFLHPKNTHWVRTIIAGSLFRAMYAHSARAECQDDFLKTLDNFTARQREVEIKQKEAEVKEKMAVVDRLTAARTKLVNALGMVTRGETKRVRITNESAKRYEGRNGTVALSSIKNPQMGPGYKQLEVGYDDPTGDDFLVGVN